MNFIQPIFKSVTRYKDESRYNDFINDWLTTTHSKVQELGTLENIIITYGTSWPEITKNRFRGSAVKTPHSASFYRHDEGLFERFSLTAKGVLTGGPLKFLGEVHLIGLSKEHADELLTTKSYTLEHIENKYKELGYREIYVVVQEAGYRSGADRPSIIIYLIVDNQ